MASKAGTIDDGISPGTEPRHIIAAACAVVGVCLVLAVASGVAIGVPWFPAAAMVAFLVTVWCIQRPSRWVYLLIATIFLESTGTSLYAGGARIRPAQLILLPALLNLCLYVVGDPARLRRIPLLAPLLFYLACNFLSTLFSVSLRQSLKIFVLLTSLVVLYIAVYTFLRNDPAAWPSVFRFYIFIGLLQVGYGLYQVAAAYLNARLGLTLPIGALGIVHAQYLGTVFGRPYGTLPEPDTYGAVCLFYALLLGLMWASASNRFLSGRRAFLVAMAALGGLLIGMVRASWLGFLVGLGWAVWTLVTGRFRGIRTLRVTFVLSLAFVVVAGMVATSPIIRRVLARRLSTGQNAAETAISFQNARFRQMLASYYLWRQRPFLGNGPGSFSILGIRGAHEEYYIYLGSDSTRIYDPSIVTTVLNDTGLLGVVAFLLLAGAYFVHVRRRVRRLRDRVSQSAALAGHCAIVGLFASFIFTHYFWLPLTWLFLAMTMLLFEPAVVETHSPSARAT